MSEQNAEKDFILDLEMKLKINEHLLDILFPLNINKRVRGIVASGEQSVLRLYVIKSFLPSLKKIISYIRRIFEHKNKKIKRIFYFFVYDFLFPERKGFLPLCFFEATAWVSLKENREVSPDFLQDTLRCSVVPRTALF